LWCVGPKMRVLIIYSALVLLPELSFYQCCGSRSIRIRTSLVGVRFRSGHLQPDPGPNKWPIINFFGVCKFHKYIRNLCFLTFWVMTILSREYFHQKHFQKKLKNYLGQDQDLVKNHTDPQHCFLLPALAKIATYSVKSRLRHCK
jgi:hypothetical protein